MASSAAALAAQKAAIAAIIKGYKATQYVNYLGVAGHALIVADFLHTFPNEIRLMWPTPLSIPKALFFSLRYYILVHHVLAILYGLPTGLSPETCRIAFLRIGISSILVVTASEAILFIRVYAFSGRNKKILVYLILQFIAIHATAFALLTRFLKTVNFVKLPIPNLVCMPASAKSTMLGGVFALLLGSVVIVMFIMMYIAFRKHRNFNSALLTVFYRDGIFYFICLSALASANILVNLAAPEGGLKFLFVQTEIDIHVILSTRMLLHLRGWAERDRRAGKNVDTNTMAGALEYSTAYHGHAHGTRDRAPSPMQFQAREVAAPLRSHLSATTTTKSGSGTGGSFGTDTELGTIKSSWRDV
ncbi:hypothetical protein DFP72DRAFT_475194 [Ephemerocybe angulata]|uniref:DUF6533 domain-containing protein n=1 Tax=Ephemerocybe angulata TaxID=980116 RepID=A0A8H6HQV1_9AGAR|nr:hypothetical protein DFP72DRAFT_475194 [Tulosesus angulatus]